MRKLTSEQLSRVLSESAAGTLAYGGSMHTECTACVAEAAFLEPVRSAQRRRAGDGWRLARDRWWQVSDATRDEYGGGADARIYNAASQDALLRALEDRDLA